MSAGLGTDMPENRLCVTAVTELIGTLFLAEAEWPGTYNLE